MTIANIAINGADGSLNNANIGSIYNLNQFGGVWDGTVTSVTWTLGYSPPESVANFMDILSGVPKLAPPFTNRFQPDVPGTYLIILDVVDSGPHGTTQDTQAIAIKFLPDRRVPAAGESDQFDSPDGWAIARNDDIYFTDRVFRQISPFGGPPLVVYNSSGILIPRNTLMVVHDTQIAANLNVTRLTDLFGHSHVTGIVPQYVVKARAWSLGSAPASPDEFSGRLLFALDDISNATAGYGFCTGYNYHDTSAWTAAGDPIYIQDDGSIGPSPGSVVRDVGEVVVKGTASSDVPGYVYLDSRIS